MSAAGEDQHKIACPAGQAISKPPLLQHPAYELYIDQAFSYSLRHAQRRFVFSARDMDAT
jgi:hypothetical protein